MTAGRPRFAAVAVLALLASSSAASSRIGPTARASGAPGASATRTRVPLWKIVYTRADGRLGVWMSNQRRLFALEGVPADPGSIGNWPAAWSPDGKDIAFARAKGQTGIYVVRVGHGRPRRLFTTDQEAYGVALAWSPDGRTLAFSVDCVDDPSVTGCRGVTALYTIHRDGTGLRQLTSVPAQALSIPQIGAMPGRRTADASRTSSRTRRQATPPATPSIRSAPRAADLASSRERRPTARSLLRPGRLTDG